MNKKAQFIWMIFTVLLLASIIIAVYALLVYSHTPMLVHDTLHGIGALNDAQREVLYPALLKAYRPIVFGCAIALLAWPIFAAFVLRSSRPRGD